MLINRKQVLNIVPSLQEDAQDPIVFVAWRRSQTHSDLPLEHARANGYALAVLQEAKENLTGDIVWIVAYQGKRSPPLNAPIQVDAEEVPRDDTPLKEGEMLQKVSNALSVYLDDPSIVALAEEKLREHTHTRAYLKHGEVSVSREGVGDTLSDIEVCEEVLSESFFGSYLYHRQEG